MRRANDSKFLTIDTGTIIGINLGADFTAEHEWGITGIQQDFGINTSNTAFGIDRRKITKVPAWFDWTTGAAPNSEGFYLWQTWNDKKPSFVNNSELATWGKHTLACAWDDKSFGVFSSNLQEIAHLKDMFTAFQNNDGTIFLGGGALWGNAGLCLVIASRIPTNLLDGWYKADKEAYDLDQEVEQTGIRQLLKERGKHYFALSRPHHRKQDGELTMWLNPMEQRENNSGWFTIHDLREWADGKGKIPKQAVKP